MYVVKSKGHKFIEYILFVAEQLGLDEEDIEFGVYPVENIWDATEFLDKDTAEGFMDLCSLHEDDWEVVER